MKADGSIVAWGRNETGQMNVPPPNTNFVALAAGSFHVLGLTDDDCEACDMNCDGEVNPLDIEPFIDLLFEPGATPCSSCAGDANGDGNVDASDIEAFIACLFGP